MASSAKKKKRMQVFKEEYCVTYPCMQKSKRGEHFTRCGSDFSISASGLYDIQRHIAGKKHALMADIPNTNHSVRSYFQSDSSTTSFEHQVISAELLWSRFVVEHNLPIATSDHATKLFKVMFPWFTTQGVQPYMYPLLSKSVGTLAISLKVLWHSENLSYSNIHMHRGVQK